MTSTVPVLMPQLGLEVTEGTVTAVLVEVGADVHRDQPLMELETDKAVTEVVAPCDGLVESIEAGPGETVSVGAVLIRLASEAETDSAVAPAGTAATVSTSDGPPRLRVAPVARRAATRLGVDLTTITGTGPRGRITLYDVEGAAGNGVGHTEPAPEGREEMTAVRRAVARRMTASQLIPQYHLARDVDATHLMAEKTAQESRGGAKVGINDLLIQAIAETAIRHPLLATVYVDGDPPYLLRRERIDVGLAVATERGLVVPVIRAAHEQGLAAIAAARQQLVSAARGGRLTLEEMSGGTITLSSLAALGVDRFTAMVNPGESAIVAVGRTVERLVPRGMTISIVPMLTLTLSFDHRVVDGADGAAALGEMVELLEGGMTWRP
jgi:pyruvate dehydrogenase E2 component (dihydrolipoamide acetyltransferase)